MEIGALYTIENQMFDHVVFYNTESLLYHFEQDVEASAKHRSAPQKTIAMFMGHKNGKTVSGNRYHICLFLWENEILSVLSIDNLFDKVI